MTNEFTEIMSKRSDEELIEILSLFKDDYQPDAIEAAEKELAKRNLSTETIETARQEIDEKYWMIEDKANMPLEPHWKILTCIFPVFLNIIIGGTYKADGYDRKFSELVRFTLYGLGFYVGLTILIAILIRL
jgi:hypothetical protein